MSDPDDDRKAVSAYLDSVQPQLFAALMATQHTESKDLQAEKVVAILRAARDGK